MVFKFEVKILILTGKLEKNVKKQIYGEFRIMFGLFQNCRKNLFFLNLLAYSLQFTALLIYSSYLSNHRTSAVPIVTYQYLQLKVSSFEILKHYNGTIY